MNDALSKKRKKKPADLNISSGTEVVHRLENFSIQADVSGVVCE